MTKKENDHARIPRGVTADHKAFGHRLRAARMKAGISQDVLAKQLGISFQQVQKYEKGTNRMDPMRMIKAAKMLDTTMDELLAIDMKKKNGKHAEFEAMLATRECVQVIEAMKDMSQPQRQFLVDLARKLPYIASAA